MARLGDYVRIRTGKLDANASSENGRYPFFTCAVEPLRIDSYSYDCECVLVAGNGDLNVKYYNGKFDAYQRTYIIESIDKSVLSVPYLYFFLDKYVETLRYEAIGGVIKYIKLGNLTEAQIPLLSLEEQAKVVCEIDKANDLISLRKQQLQKLDELVKARFVELFNGKYDTVKIGDVFSTTSGGTPSKSHPEYYENGTIPWLSSGEVNIGVIHSVKDYITQEGVDNSSAKMVPENSVVIAMYGATAGQVGLLRIATTTNQAVCSVLPDNRYVPEYLYYAIKSKKDWMISQCAGGAQPNISQGVIKRMEIIDAPYELQKQFASFVEQTDKSKLTVQQSLDKLETLKRSLMQKYFG